MRTMKMGHNSTKTGTTIDVVGQIVGDWTVIIKKLTKKEIEEGKKFILHAFGNWSAVKGKGDVPDGQPPKVEENEKKKE